MSRPVRIPADVDRPDRVLGPLTARQLTILGVTGLLLYALYGATRSFLPLPLFLLVAIPIGLAVAVVALGRRDGVPLDRLLLAAVRQRFTPRRQVSAPEGVGPVPAWLAAESEEDDVAPTPLELPARGVDDGTTAGVVDLGDDGLAVIAACSTVNFSLRTAAEQEALVSSFARYLHSLTAPVQFLVRAERLDLAPQIDQLRDRAGGLPHPALEAAALDHADYLAQLGQHADLLRRQVLLVLREPTRSAVVDSVSSTLGRLRRRPAAPTVDHATRQAGEQRLARRLNEAVELLTAAGIVVTALDAATATGVLAAACNPDTFLPPSAALAGAGDVVTAADFYDDFEDR
ncbi:PrgI family protein [Amycolatopsis sp. FBCC-B4732]|uniref:PrgI family protein n=1 Tax=Amycolatopsis sp. FBCC-B4732 TaxID=3079339 RepID=UPI001FF19531|nr:PrgI family protein [Amycolatopsis sp. FBCC-B4732]UOX90396.1 PrgI family protein [Amycolatopsis sp. FBCC-B4732]